MFKNKFIICVLVCTGLCFVLTGCGKDTNKATPGTAVSLTPTPTVTEAPTPTPTNTPAATPTPTPTPVGWYYQIVQNGYYNAAATWDENENLVAYPEPVADEYIYYNDCDEYYNNFIRTTNVFNNAMITLDDSRNHSGDNSIKITGRDSQTKGFSGFALILNEDNAIPYANYNQTTNTLGFWVYYQDDFNNGVPETLTFAVYSNLDKSLSPSECNTVKEPEEPTDEETEIYENTKSQNKYATDRGFSLLTTAEVAFKTWTYIEVPFNIDLDSVDEDYAPMLAITTLGESNSDNITFYNPYYIDDITITHNQALGAQSSEAANE